MNNPFVLFFLLACVLLAGCKRNTSINGKPTVESLLGPPPNPYTDLAISNLNQRISAVEAKNDEWEANHREWVAIDPDSQSYQQLWTPFGVLLVITKSVTPYLDGYKVKVAIGNPYFVTFSGFKLAYRVTPKPKTFTYDQAKQAGPWQKYETNKTSAVPDFSSLHPILPDSGSRFDPAKPFSRIYDEDRTETLQPGAWNEVEFTVAPASAADIRRLRISIHLNEIHLNDNSASN